MSPRRQKKYRPDDIIHGIIAGLNFTRRNLIRRLDTKTEALSGVFQTGGRATPAATPPFGPPLPCAEGDGILLHPSSDFLSALELPDRDALFALTRRKVFKKGARIFEAGDPAAMLYILESGRVKIYKTAPSGKEIILWFCFPGETFGLAELSRGVERTISAQAVDGSDVLCLLKTDFLRFITERPSVALCAIDILSTRLRRLGQIFMNLATEDVPFRLARMILDLAYGATQNPCAEARGNDEICINITLTHQEIADMIGASRQTVTTALSEFKRRGAIRWTNHHLHVETPDVLERIIREHA